MPIYEILTAKGNVRNIIIADYAFVEANYPKMFRDITPIPPKEIESIPEKTLEQKVDELMDRVELLTRELWKNNLFRGDV